MKKTILNLGKVLDKAQQKSINGGGRPYIGSGCAQRCPSTCASLGGVCVPCPISYDQSGFECKIFA